MTPTREDRCVRFSSADRRSAIGKRFAGRPSVIVDDVVLAELSNCVNVLLEVDGDKVEAFSSKMVGSAETEGNR